MSTRSSNRKATLVGLTRDEEFLEKPHQSAGIASAETRHFCIS